MNILQTALIAALAFLVGSMMGIGLSEEEARERAWHDAERVNTQSCYKEGYEDGLTSSINVGSLELDYLMNRIDFLAGQIGKKEEKMKQMGLELYEYGHPGYCPSGLPVIMPAEIC